MWWCCSSPNTAFWSGSYTASDPVPLFRSAFTASNSVASGWAHTSSAGLTSTLWLAAVEGQHACARVYVCACVSVLLAGRCHLLTANRTSPTMNGVFYKRVLWLASSMVVPHEGDNVSGCKHAHKALLLRVPYWRFAHICIMGTHAVRAVGHTSRHTHDKEQQQRQPPNEALPCSTSA